MNTAALIDKRAAIINYAYQRGDTVAEPVQILEGGVAADITGRTYRAQLRRYDDDPAPIDFTVDIIAPTVGQLVLRLDDTQSALLDGTYQWDLEQNAGGVIRTLLGGTWLFDPDTTHS